MSSPIVNINANTQTEHQVVGKVAATEQTKEPRAKKETLSAKYSKFLIFGYSLIQSLKSQDLLTDESVERAYAEIKLMDSVEDQTEFYETYLSQSNETGKVMRKFIVQRNKPPKAAKAKKEKKENVDQEVKAKKPRTKKTEKVTADGDADIVNELVAAATGETETEEGVVVEKTEEAPKVKKVKELTAEQQSVKDAKAKEVADKKEAKAKEVAEKKEAKAKEVAEKKEAKEVKAKEVADKKEAKEAKTKEVTDKKEAKEADAKAKTTAEVENISVSISEESVVEESVVEESVVEESVVEEPVVEEPVVEESEEDEEVHTQEITVDGKEYLVDGLNHIYSVITHEEIGTYDPTSRTIQLDHA